MNQFKPVSSKAYATMQEHDELPIHLCGMIQPQGCLIAADKSDLRITRVSQNIEEFLGSSPTDLLDQPLGSVLQPSELTQLEQTLNIPLTQPTHLLVQTSLPNHDMIYDGLTYQTEQEIVLELEPTTVISTETLIQHQNHLNQALSKLHQITDLDAFLQDTAVILQQWTDFSHVMIYKFDAQQAGCVVAEIVPPDNTSYLGLHFPATDVPKSVRQLYQQGLHRFTPNLSAPSVPIINIKESAPLDLTHSSLRSMDPCCVTYHQNMGVDAFLVLSLVKDQKLWGLITCHHNTPKSLPYSIRNNCSVLGQFISAELGQKVNREELEAFTQLNITLSKFVDSIRNADTLKEALTLPGTLLLDLVNAQGAAVCLDGEITLLGQTPKRDQVEALLQWSDSTISTNLFDSNQLSAHYSDASDYQDVASGLIVLKISQARQYQILWFRPEVLQTITWAGNPDDNLQADAEGNLELCPRASFQAWQETVQSTALPWKQAELNNALDLRSAIVGIVMNRADELAQINLELERSNQELTSFAYAASHDLKEPLRGIHNFSNLLIKKYSDVLDDSGRSRLQTLVRLAQRMDLLIDGLLKLSRLGQAQLELKPTDLNALVQKTIEVLQASRTDATDQAKFCIERPLPVISCDPMLVGEVFTNLFSNALKYTRKEHPVIEIGYLTTDEQEGMNLPLDIQKKQETFIFFVRDNGIGIRERHQKNIFRLFKRLHEREAYGGGAGAGLTITKKIIERHQGAIWIESVYEEGTTFYFMLT